MAEGEGALHQAGIPTFQYPDAAARALCALWRYNRNLSALYETPALRIGPAEAADVPQAGSIIKAAYAAGRVLLTEVESKQVLEAYGIPTVPTKIARSEQAAVDLAATSGGPVVLKVFSKAITHKSDAGGVRLGLRDGEAVRQAYRDIERTTAGKFGAQAFLGVTVQPMIPADGYELLLGSTTDPQLGPVVVFGTGGRLVEVLKDRALGLPPLNATLAQRLIDRCRIYRALQGVRGQGPINFAELETVLIRFSQLVAEQRRIKEIDVNPLLASAARIVALDARVVLHDPNLTDDQLPQLAIRPYPTEYIFHHQLRDGTPVTLRPICPEDEPLVAEFHNTLSQQTVHYRYFSFLKLESRIAHDRLRRICFNDYDCEIALVAEGESLRTQAREILGIGRLIKSHGLNEAEFAIVIGDGWQGQGLGTELLRRLLQIGRQEGIDQIVGYILSDNHPMRRVCEKLGFNLRYDAESEVYKAIIKTYRPDAQPS